MKLQPIYDALGENKVQALRGFHAISGCDTTGHIFGTSKTSWWKIFLKSDDSVIRSLTALGKGPEPTEEVLEGCEEFICQVLRAKKETFITAKELRWHVFRGLVYNKGVDKLPPTQGALFEHIRRAHLQCSVWQQALIPTPLQLDPQQLGWSLEASGKFKPILSRLPPAPESVTQLVRCRCVKSMCDARCSCKQNGIECTELCTCEANPEMCKNVQHLNIDESEIISQE